MEPDVAQREIAPHFGHHVRDRTWRLSELVQTQTKLNELALPVLKELMHIAWPFPDRA
jgi:hypothetical protein